MRDRPSRGGGSRLRLRRRLRRRAPTRDQRAHDVAGGDGEGRCDRECDRAETARRPCENRALGVRRLVTVERGVFEEEPLGKNRILERR